MVDVVATGLGSWPGDDVREALRVVRGELTGTVPAGVQGLPYLPELPARGPGADLVGRSAHLLVDLPVDLAPQGWRLVDRPGRDAARASALWREDLDELAEAFDGYAGRLKVQVAGPWTLAAALWKPLGDRVLSDVGATRDLIDSLAEGVRSHVLEVRRLLPGADLVVQVDEPSLPAVLAGHVRSDSGLNVLRAPEAAAARAALGQVLEAAKDAGAVLTVVHCCAAEVPISLLRGAGADAISLDVALLPRRSWEPLAEAVESGGQLWAGLLTPSTSAELSRARAEQLLAPVLTLWHEVGLERARLVDVAVTPTCGLSGSTPDGALEITASSVALARALADLIDG